MPYIAILCVRRFPILCFQKHSLDTLLSEMLLSQALSFAQSWLRKTEPSSDKRVAYGAFFFLLSFVCQLRPNPGDSTARQWFLAWSQTSKSIMFCSRPKCRRKGDSCLYPLLSLWSLLAVGLKTCLFQNSQLTQWRSQSLGYKMIKVSRDYESLAVQSTMRCEGPAATWPQLCIQQQLSNATALALVSMQTWPELTWCIIVKLHINWWLMHNLNDASFLDSLKLWFIAESWHLQWRCSQAFGLR